MEDYFKNVVIFDHPLIAHKITHLCDINTGTKEFNEIVGELSMLMGYEALRDMETELVEIQAPLAKFKSPVLKNNFTIVPILRARLGMVDGLRTLSPTARVGHIGMYRDEKTLEPHVYFHKMPADAKDGPVIIVDPALATGGSMEAAVRFVKEKGCTNIKCMCLIAAPEGVRRVMENHPDVKLYIAKYADAPLNEKGYIVTAFGDAGDRVFGTK